MAKKETDRLPGMEEPEIEELEQLAKSYAKLRDKRQAVLAQEVNLKGQLLACMKKNSKIVYVHGNVSIDVVVEEETVKVKIRKPEEEE